MMVDICDIELIGKKLVQNGLVVSLTKEYYQQEVIEQSQACHLLQTSDIANIVGNRITKQAIEMKLAKEISIRKIGGVPFLMIYKFQHR
jgi:hypothetical protein